MPKSKNRGGKKAHRKKVQNRNKRLNDLRNRHEKYQKEMYEELMKQYEAQMEREGQGEEREEKIDGIDGPEL